MADVFLFIRHGWKSVWKQKTIWLFSSLSIPSLFSNVIQFERDANLPLQCISFLLSPIFIILSFSSIIGVPYLAYRFLIGNAATIQDTLAAVKKFSGRVIGCSCLGFLPLIPIFLWVVATTKDSSMHILEISNKMNLVLLPVAIFASLGHFTFIAFFENDWGIRQSLEKAWSLFKSHFSILVTLGVILTIIYRAFSTISGILTILIQSGFDIASINNFNIFNPFASLSNNLLFVCINGIGQIIFTALSASIYVSAYLKYSNVKLPFQMRVK